MGRRSPRTRYRLRRRQPRDRRHAVYDMPVVGRAAVATTHRRAARGSGDAATRALDLGPSCATCKLAYELGRQAPLRRHGAGAVDWAAPAHNGDLRPRASITLHPGWIV